VRGIILEQYLRQQDMRVTQYYTWTNMLKEIDFNNVSVYVPVIYFLMRSCHGHNRLVVGFTTTYVINAYYHKGCEFESRTWRGVFNTILCDKVCQWLATGRWFSPGNLVYNPSIYFLWNIQFVSDLRQVGGFLRALRFPPPIKLIATI
jgi:hypothetical protein